MYQRGPNGEEPNGLSFRNLDHSHPEYGTIGEQQHVSAYWEGGHRSWENPGTGQDHSTDHATGRKTQH